MGTRDKIEQCTCWVILMTALHLMILISTLFLLEKNNMCSHSYFLNWIVEVLHEF